MNRDSSDPSPSLLTLVIPVYDEEANVEPVAREVLEVLAGRPLEILFVDDGSRDGTFATIRRMHAQDARVRGLRLRSNSGKAAAYQAGFRAAKGAIVATMDGDLQDDPRDLPRLVETLEEGSADLVVGWKKTGKSSLITFILSRLFNFFLRLVTGVKLHDMNCPLRVMRPEVARSLDLRADLHRYIPLLATAKGFRVKEVSVENRPRVHGESKYGGSKYVSSATSFLGMSLYLRFGERPMLLFGSLGLLTFLAGMVICAWVAFGFLFGGADIDDDLPTLVLGVLLTLIGTQFLSLGLLAEILVRRLKLVEDRAPSEVAEEIG